MAIGASSATPQAPRPPQEAGHAARTGDYSDHSDYTDDTGRPQLRRRLERADLSAVPGARHALRELLHNWGKPGRSDIAELLTSELVTNALVHTDDDAVLTATVGPDGLHVEVRDFVAQLPHPRASRTDDSTHGRGLLLVQSLADDWGVRPHGIGKAVWFELGAEAA